MTSLRYLLLLVTTLFIPSTTTNSFPAKHLINEVYAQLTNELPEKSDLPSAHNISLEKQLTQVSSDYSDVLEDAFYLFEDSSEKANQESFFCTPLVWKDLQLLSLDHTQSKYHDGKSLYQTLSENNQTVSGKLLLATYLADGLARTQNNSCEVKRELNGRASLISQIASSSKIKATFQEDLARVKPYEHTLLKVLTEDPSGLVKENLDSLAPSKLWGSLRSNPHFRRIHAFIIQKSPIAFWYDQKRFAPLFTASVAVGTPLLLVLFALSKGMSLDALKTTITNMAPFLGINSPKSLKEKVFSTGKFSANFTASLMTSPELCVHQMLDEKWQERKIYPLLYDQETQADEIKQITRAIAALTLLGGVLLFKPWNRMSKARLFDNYTFIRTHAVAQMVRSARSISSTLTGISDLPSSLKILNESVTNYLESDVGQKIVALCKKPVFDSDEKPSMFSDIGTIRCLHEVICDQDLKELLFLIASVDAYNSIEKFASKTSKNKVCLAQADFESTAPYIKAEGFWNPLIDTNVAVSSSVLFGQENPRTILLTGLNAGGKSTLLKSLALNIILAQSFGVAAAESFTYTPFEMILGHFTSRDNTAGGQSLFVTEAETAKSMVASVKKALSNGNFVCTFTDELMSGTGHEASSKLMSKFSTTVANSANTINMFATHIQELTKLAEEHPTIFANYRMGKKKGPKGFEYTYQLESGINTDNIAEDIYEAIS